MNTDLYQKLMSALGAAKARKKKAEAKRGREDGSGENSRGGSRKKTDGGAGEGKTGEDADMTDLKEDEERKKEERAEAKKMFEAAKAKAKKLNEPYKRPKSIFWCNIDMTTSMDRR